MHSSVQCGPAELEQSLVVRIGTRVAMHACNADRTQTAIGRRCNLAAVPRARYDTIALD